MGNLTKFVFEDKEVRVILLEDQPWFVAKNIATIFEYTKVDKMLQLVDDEDKKVINPQKLDSPKLEESFNSNTFRLSIVNESGLYAIIFNSKKPEAKAFKRWVTSEVLPSIRKTGIFNTMPFKLSDDSKLVSFENDDYWVSTLTIAKLFEKRHDNVLRDFESAYKELSDLLNFEEFKKFKKNEVTFIDNRQRSQKVFKINRTLFNYVVLGYTGRNAKIYRAKFILAFEELEKQVKIFLTQQTIYPNLKRQQVYILKNTITNMIKVGVTNDIKRRLSELQNASGCEINVEYLAPKSDNAQQIESFIHKKLSAKRGIGEWFNVSVEEAINVLVKASLVIDVNKSNLLNPPYIPNFSQNNR